MHSENRTALVTGAAGTMGLAVVKAFLEEGSTVVLVDINADGLSKLTGELGA
ncbi:MAG: SDR family NAD(P)-dependent oxidoreductase, partial [Spirochaetales bacterium]|nr:SDR family NAD(P)-dependent oxidoreductase [Spirochaetales bacterium]